MTRRRILLKKLPVRFLRLLRQIGQLADSQGLPLHLVGGVVRDQLLKRRNWDLDLTVDGDGPAFARVVARNLHAGVVVYDRFATARLTLPDGTKIDIASTRRESYAEPAALPDVQPASLAEDLYRRDFTINAMALRLNAEQWGELYDPYGGERDLRARKLRVLHDRSFIDDPTRIFRAVRFAQRFGFRFEHATARLLEEAARSNQIARLSGPRLRNEILLLLAEPNPSRTVAELVRLNLLRFLHPRLRFGKGVAQVMERVPMAIGWWTRSFTPPLIETGVAMLMALLHESTMAVVDGVISRLMLSGEQAQKVRWAGRPLCSIARRLASAKLISPSSLHRLLIGLPNETHLLVLAQAMAEKDRAGLARTKKRLKVFVTQLRSHKPLLRGRDLMEIGLKSGPRLGKVLGLVADAQLDGLIKTKPQALVLARRLARNIHDGSSLNHR